MPIPQVSVIMSVFNDGAFLDQAIRSIREQSLADFEFVIVDDGSTDAGPALLRRHAAEDGRIRILRQDNLGLVAALNRALAAASTPYVARFDADDVAKPHRLERQLAALSAEPSLAVLGSAYEVIDAAGTVVRQVRLPTDPADIRETLERTNCMAHPTVMMRRDVVLAAGGYRRAYLLGEDYDLWLRLGERGDLANLADPLVAYRVRPGKLSVERIEQQILSELAARAAAARRRAGLDDPTGTADLITRDVLQALGVDRREISFQVARRALQAARRSRRLGDRRQAQDAVGLARRQERRGLYQRAYYLLMRAKVYF